MPDSDDPLSSVATARAVAPIIDRLRMALVARTVPALRQLAIESGVGADGAQTLAMMRNAQPDRIVHRDQVAAVFRYLPPEQVERGIAEALAAGVVAEVGDEQLVMTAAGREFLVVFAAEFEAAIAERWGGQEHRIESLSPLVTRVVEEAVETGGDAFGLVAPVYVLEGTSAGFVLAEQLTPLRFHRYDAHVAAWRAAGWDAQRAASEPDGPEREAVEADTDVRSGPPYEVLSPSERLALVAGLGALPG
jgi:hypothetical protein